jgi:hypothetical protein
VRLGGARFRYVRCLKRDFFSENHLLEDERDGRPHVLKVSRPLGFLAGRERARYRRAAGIEGIPALGPVQGERWLLHEYVEGVTLDYLAPVAPDFYEHLERIVRALHDRGIIYLDLSKRENVIVQPDGRPALIDFQISLLFGRGGRPRASTLAGRIFDGLASADLYQVYKHRRRHGHARGADDERLGRERSALHLFHRSWIRDPWLAFRRRMLPRWW